jgi:hypothetical protein
MFVSYIPIVLLLEFLQNSGEKQYGAPIFSCKMPRDFVGRNDPLIFKMEILLTF